MYQVSHAFATAPGLALTDLARQQSMAQSMMV